jgi:hypothetical protein
MIIAQDLELHDILLNNPFLQSLAAYEVLCYRTAGELLDRLSMTAKTANISPSKEITDRTRTARKAVESRLREQQHGDYDWLAQRLEQRYLIEAADFIGRIKLDWAAGKGGRLFLTRDVRAGEILIVEKVIGVGVK